jgi:hypothetical protein
VAQALNWQRRASSRRTQRLLILAHGHTPASLLTRRAATPSGPRKNVHRPFANNSAPIARGKWGPKRASNKPDA